MSHGGKEYRERLQYQLRVIVDPLAAKTQQQADDLAARAKAHFERTGKVMKGCRIEARWRNPDRKNPDAARWKSTNQPGQSLTDFYKTITKRVR